MTYPSSNQAKFRYKDEKLNHISDQSSFVEVFREALMNKHHHDWDMETVAEAAYICNAAIEPYLEVWAETLNNRSGR